MVPFNFKPIKLKKPKIKKRGALPKKRDIAVAINFLNKRIRKPLDAKTRKKVWQRAKNTCEYPRCSHKKNLHIHHKNQNNDDNKLSNLILLCPNHHAEYHDKYKRISKKDIVGREIGSKVVSKKKAKRIKKEKKQNPLGFHKLDFGI